MKKTTLIIIFVAAGIAILMLAFAKPKAPEQSIAPGANVHLEGSVQIIDLRARGGFSPEKTVAKAGIPTILRVATDGTFDCSSSVRIPALKFSKILKPTGTEDIDLGSPKAGTLQGMCGMGMYPFVIEFEK